MSDCPIWNQSHISISRYFYSIISYYSMNCNLLDTSMRTLWELELERASSFRLGRLDIYWRWLISHWIEPLHSSLSFFLFLSLSLSLSILSYSFHVTMLDSKFLICLYCLNGDFEKRKVECSYSQHGNQNTRIYECFD